MTDRDRFPQGEWFLRFASNDRIWYAYLYAFSGKDGESSYMDDGSRLSWLIVILLLLAAMFFAVAETAFASVSKTRLKTRADKGDRRAKKALFITDNFDRAITTILICTNIVHLAAASLVTVIVTRKWGLSAVTVSTLLTTLAVFFFGEMLPKSIARKYSESLSLFTASPLSFFMTILKPFALLLTAIGNFVSGLTKGDAEATVTEEELYDIIEDMTEEGALDEDQMELISSALQFKDVNVESIVTSRVDVAALDVTMEQDKILERIKDENHSRLPVYEGSIDNIIGVLQIRKYIKAYLKEQEALDLRSLLDEPYFVHQSTKIDDLLTTMSQKKLNMAIVTDNYGGTLGIVTVEDILEELVGEIWDEDDRVVNSITPMAEGAYSVDAEESVLDVLEELDIDYTEEEEDRLMNKLMSELVFENFTDMPKEGDSFFFLGTQITVLSMKRSRIYRVKVRKCSPEELAEQADESRQKEETE
ncbi:MAG: HlyC/CorC family transporter [Lachnospiraceae bacterium]|nr:HlyC/CorC family transporter [Lachnospiraceae bacterium]